MNKKWRQVMLTLSILSVLALTAFAQGGRGGRGGGGGFGGGGFGGGRGGGGFPGMGGGSDTRFVLRDDVKGELDLSEKQIEEIEAIEGPDMRSIMQDSGIDFRSIRGMDEEERAEAMKPMMDKIAEANKEARESVMDILKSKQRSRYKELKFQYDVSNRNISSALAAAEVKLDSSKQKKLDAELRAVREKLRKQYEEMQNKAYRDILASFMDSGDIDELMSDEFEFESTQLGFGRGGNRGGRDAAGGRGGRGGDAGGRGGRGGDAGGRGGRRGAGGDGEEDAPTRRRRPA